MQIDILGTPFGTNPRFWDIAFFGPAGLNYTTSGTTSTEVFIVQPDSGNTTTLTGTGFIVDGAGNLTAGTITGFSFLQSGAQVGTITDINWSASDFIIALDEWGIGDTVGMEAYFATQPIKIDASASTTGYLGVSLEIPFAAATKFIGSILPDYFDGGIGNDIIRGKGSNDTLDGNDGDDRLYGGSGSDHLIGGAGNDILFGGAKQDYLYGGVGNDRMIGGAANDYLEGSTGKDVLKGNRGNDELLGGDGNDRLFGHEGSDDLHGGLGNDRLTGGLDDDRLRGSLGADIFIFDRGIDEGSDIISDFEDGIDLIQIMGQPGSDIASIEQYYTTSTLITLTSGTTIELYNIDAADISYDDFLFLFIPI